MDHRLVARFAIEEATIADIQCAYGAGAVTVREVVQAHLDRIAAYDRKGPALGAIILTNPAALADADRLDDQLRRSGQMSGPLHGIPVLVKDNYDVAGLQTTGGSSALLGWVPAKDATVVQNCAQPARSSSPKPRCRSGLAAALTISIPCCPALRAIRTTRRMPPEDPRAAPGRALQRAFASSGWARTHLDRSAILHQITRWWDCEQAGRWFHEPAWSASTMHATPPDPWRAP